MCSVLTIFNIEKQGLQANALIVNLDTWPEWLPHCPEITVLSIKYHKYQVILEK